MERSLVVALERRLEALDAVGVDAAPDVLGGTVAHGVVVRQAGVGRGLVRVDRRAGNDLPFDESLQRRAGRVVHDLGRDAPGVAVPRPHGRRHVRSAAPRLGFSRCCVVPVLKSLDQEDCSGDRSNFALLPYGSSVSNLDVPSEALRLSPTCRIQRETHLLVQDGQVLDVPTRRLESDSAIESVHNTVQCDVHAAERHELSADETSEVFRFSFPADRLA